jgi:hypothetical protein
MRRLSILALCVCSGLIGCSAMPPPSLNELQQIEGEIVHFDADGYVIKDGYGRKFRVQAAPSARVDGNLTAGDTVRIHIGAPYAQNVRYASAVHLFNDTETAYGEMIAKNRSSLVIKDQAAVRLSCCSISTASDMGGLNRVIGSSQRPTGHLMKAKFRNFRTAPATSYAISMDGKFAMS